MKNENSIVINTLSVHISKFEEEYINKRRPNKKIIPKLEQTAEDVHRYITENSVEFKHISTRFLTEELCCIVVSRSASDLRFIPEKLKTKKVCFTAVLKNGKAIEYVDKSLIDEELAFVAVRQKFNDVYSHPINHIPRRLITKELIEEAVAYTPCCLKFVTKEFINEKLCKKAVSLDGRAIEFVPEEFVNSDLVDIAISVSLEALKMIPKSFLNKEKCNQIFKENINAFQYIPSKYKNLNMCLGFIEKIADKFSFKDFCSIPVAIRENTDFLNKLMLHIPANTIIRWDNIVRNSKPDFGEAHYKSLSEKAIKHLETKVQRGNFINRERCALPEAQNSNDALDTNSVVAYDFSNSDETNRLIYYISDIHLEHQFELFDVKLSDDELEECINQKVQEIITSCPDNTATLMIAGDVACSKKLVDIFISNLSNKWRGKIIYTLGNHELWDCYDEEGNTLAIDEIVTKYQHVDQVRYSARNKIFLLNNSLFLHYKNVYNVVLTENDLLNISNEVLREAIKMSSLAVFGGTGFAGLNSRYNSTCGLYKDAVTRRESERDLSKRFEKLYKKISSVASDKNLVVLTHMQPKDWTSQLLNKNWIYVCGHDHINKAYTDDDGAVVLADNQIGYKARKLNLKSFTIDNSYEMFDSLLDGIHLISSNEYREFNIAKGILSYGCNQKGSIYMLKRFGYYMFLFKPSSKEKLYILEGGYTRVADNQDIEYYYENLPSYCAAIERFLEPYQRALQDIANEVKRFGGVGNIHGCIVDIDFYSHIYLNPFNGEATPYYSPYMGVRSVYKTVGKLLQKHRPDLEEAYNISLGLGELQTLQSNGSTTKMAHKKVEQPLIDIDLLNNHQMYYPSRIIKSLQYVVCNRVVRRWNEAFLKKANVRDDAQMISDQNA